MAEIETASMPTPDTDTDDLTVDYWLFHRDSRFEDDHIVTDHRTLCECPSPPDELADTIADQSESAAELVSLPAVEAAYGPFHLTSTVGGHPYEQVTAICEDCRTQLEIDVSVGEYNPSRPYDVWLPQSDIRTLLSVFSHLRGSFTSGSYLQAFLTMVHDHLQAVLDSHGTITGAPLRTPDDIPAEYLIGVLYLGLLRADAGRSCEQMKARHVRHLLGRIVDQVEPISMMP